MHTIYGIPLATAFLYFIFYSVLGWVLETIYCSVGQKRFVRRGFLAGPLCPIYGIGTLLIILPLAKFKDSLPLFVIISVVVMTALEYFIGWLLEITTGLKYWDYSRFKLNIKGRVCLLNSIIWGFLAYAVMFWLHPPIERLFAKIPYNTQVTLAWILAVLLVLDIAYTMHKLAVMARLLKKVEDLREQLEEQFEALDLDKDGHLNKNELHLAYQRLRERSKLHLANLRSRAPKLTSLRYKQLVDETQPARLNPKVTWAEIKDRFKKFK